MKNKNYYALNLVYDNQERKELARRALLHIKAKTGLNNAEIVFRALQEYNLLLDERGNKK